MARPSKYTPEREKRILEALSAGVSRKTAAEYAGVDPDTMLQWMRRYPGFSAAVIEAESKVEVSAVVSVRQAWMAGDWRAAIEWLKRRRSAEWSETHRVEIINMVSEMAVAMGKDKEAAVEEAERFLKELKANARHARS